MGDELCNVEEAARRLGGVSKWSIYAWVRQGRLKKTRVGSRVMFRGRDLAAFVESCNPSESVQLEVVKPKARVSHDR